MNLLLLFGTGLAGVLLGFWRGFLLGVAEGELVATLRHGRRLGELQREH